jgi:APA family basic amino acid/polyamine antiporter
MFYGFAGFGVFILRRKMPGAARAYRVWGYPVIPLIFVAFTLFYFVLTLYNDVSNYLNGKTALINSVFGLLLTLSGLPLYWYLKKKQKIKPSEA